MSDLRFRLLRKEAEKRLLDAETLEMSGPDSDSSYLLRLLSFELFLKLAVERVTGKESFGHKYHELFSALPATAQDDLLRIAGECIGPSALSSDHLGVLKDLSDNFVKLRYPYERYSNLTEEQYAALGADWIARGAVSDEADFRYHPEELRGLLLGLREALREG